MNHSNEREMLIPSERRLEPRSQKNVGIHCVQENMRMARAKNLLICIGSVFLICWIPINSINLISDLLYMCDMSLLK